MEINKPVILVFISVFIVYCTVSYIVERLPRPGETGPNFLKAYFKCIHYTQGGKGFYRDLLLDSKPCYMYHEALLVQN